MFVGLCIAYVEHMVLKSLHIFLHEKQSCNLFLYQVLVPRPDNFLLKFAMSVVYKSH